VLCVAKVRPGGHDYYLEVVNTGVEAPGKWLSAGSELLGLRGEVDGRDIEAVLGGADPSNGERLGRFHDRVKVSGFDLTFCAPKSVSLLHALSAPDVSAEVKAGHESAVKEVVSYVERHALAVRRRSDGGPQIVMDVEGVPAGGFVHRTSRALDPHLHTHVVVANLGRAPDGSWSAIDGRGVYAHVGAAGSLYHSQLRHELTERLGVSWEPLRGGRADIAGIAPHVRREFSQRAAEIEAHLADRGIGRRDTGASPSRRANMVAGLVTRADRDPNLDPDSLRGWWEQRARHAGMTPLGLEGVLDREPRRTSSSPRESALDEPAATARPETPPALEQTVEGILGDLGRSVTRRDVLRAWCSVLEAGAPVRAVEESADRYLSGLRPVEGWAGERDAPGVGERRLVVEQPGIERNHRAERHRMERLLEARGMSLSSDLGLGRGRDEGMGLGL